MNFKEVIDALEFLKEDDVPKSLTQKIEKIIIMLKNNNESEQIRLHKLETFLEELSNDVSLQPFIRTQVYHIISLL